MLKNNVVLLHNKTQEPIVYPSGKTIAHDKRYTSISISSRKIEF